MCKVHVSNSARGCAVLAMAGRFHLPRGNIILSTRYRFTLGCSNRHPPPSAHLQSILFPATESRFDLVHSVRSLSANRVPVSRRERERERERERGRGREMASSTSLFFGSTAIVTPKAVPAASAGNKSSSMNVVCAAAKGEPHGRREALKLAGTLVLGGVLAVATADKAKAGLVEDLLVKSAANKELNDRKRLATSYANTARAYTVTFGTCKFPENFTGCQDLAKKKNVPFLTDDLKLECEGKDKFKCGSNVFWKW